MSRQGDKEQKRNYSLSLDWSERPSSVRRRSGRMRWLSDNNVCLCVCVCVTLTTRKTWSSGQPLVNCWSTAGQPLVNRWSFIFFVVFDTWSDVMTDFVKYK